jgi:hypothetical protein
VGAAFTALGIVAAILAPGRPRAVERPSATPELVLATESK